MRWNELDQEPCPVARCLSVIGDRWTILILRDCFLGVRRFEQFQERLGITRHVLADRLRKLEKDGVLRREPYQDRPVRYEYRLTDKGKELHQVLIAVIGWSNRNMPIEGLPPFEVVSRETGEVVEPMIVDANTGKEITHRTVSARMYGKPANEALAEKTPADKARA